MLTSYLYKCDCTISLLTLPKTTGLRCKKMKRKPKIVLIVIFRYLVSHGWQWLRLAGARLCVFLFNWARLNPRMYVIIFKHILPWWNYRRRYLILLNWLCGYMSSQKVCKTELYAISYLSYSVFIIRHLHTKKKKVNKLDCYLREKELLASCSVYC